MNASAPLSTGPCVLLIAPPRTESLPAMRATAREARKLGGTWIFVLPKGAIAERQLLGDTTTVSELCTALGGEIIAATASLPDTLSSLLSRRHHLKIAFIAPAPGPWARLRAIGQAGFTRSDIRRSTDILQHHSITVRAAPTEPKWPSADLWYHHSTRGTMAQVFRMSVPLLMSAGVAAGLLTAQAPMAALLIFVLPIMYAAISGGLLAALIMAPVAMILHMAVSAMSLAQFAVDVDVYVTAVPVLLAIGIVSAVEAWRLRRQAARVRRHDYEIRSLFRTTRALASAPDAEELPSIISGQISRALEVTAVLWEQNANGDFKGHRADGPIDPHENLLPYLTQAEDITIPAPARSNITPDTMIRIIPLQSALSARRLLTLQFRGNIAPQSADTERLIDSLCDLASVALERRDEARQINETRVLRETENLRSALLSSISHDLGTPLASIMGSASALKDKGPAFEPEQRHDLLDTIIEESARLHRFVTNLLQITRVEAGALSPKLETLDLLDLIETLIDRTGKRFADMPINIQCNGMAPLVEVDVVLMETVLTNLLGNAKKYSPVRSPVTITVSTNQSGTAQVDIRDQGKGIPAEDLPHIFDKFFRVRQGDRKVAGTGLGLAICRGIMDSLGGSIRAESPGEGKGTTMVLILPTSTSQDSHSAPKA